MYVNLVNPIESLRWSRIGRSSGAAGSSRLRVLMFQAQLLLLVTCVDPKLMEALEENQKCERKGGVSSSSEVNLYSCPIFEVADISDITRWLASVYLIANQS